MEDLNRYLEFALSVARAAGQIQLEYFRSGRLDLQTKQNEFDVVTAADKACEKMIKDMIRDSFPDHGIISEESEPEHMEREWRWVVDPLDGTTNFSQGLPVFSISIALEHFKEPVVGVVFAPYLGELFHAVKGGGAFLNGKRIECSAKSKLEQAVLATGMPYDKADNPDNNLLEVNRIAPKVRGVRRYGSAAVDLSYVGAGFLDGYWELNLNRWDVAAGMLIVKEAGGIVYPIRENRKFSIMAAGAGLADRLREILK